MNQLIFYFLSILLFLTTAPCFAGNGLHFLPKEGPEGRNFAVIQLEGMIAYPMALEIRDHLKDLPIEDDLLIDLNSGGGSIKEGLKIIQLLRSEISKGRSIRTYVKQGRMCGSMCVPIFLQGTKRTAGTTSAFMFHGVRTAYSNVPDTRRTEELLNIFKDAGVSEEFIEELWKKEVFSTPGEYWLSGKELDEKNTAILTQLHGAHKRFEAWTIPYDPQIKPR